MNKIKAFALRNMREMLRDPLSFLFCLGFPLVMLVIMTLVDRSIPPEAGMTLFRIQNLAGGLVVFGQMFVMLFTATTVARDRSSTFLLRMYASPMASRHFVWGYLAPMGIIALGQNLLILLCSLMVSLMTKGGLSVPGLILSLAPGMVCALMLLGLGMLLGTLCSERAAPGLCSVIISLGSFLGSIWFDAEGVGGILLSISCFFPFHYATKALRSALQLQFDHALPAFAMVCGWAAVILLAAIWVFRRRMKADLA